jgi:hypothetical protein
LDELTEDFANRLEERAKQRILGSTTEIVMHRDGTGDQTNGRETAMSVYTNNNGEGAAGTIMVAEGVNPGTLSARKSRAGQTRGSMSSAGQLRDLEGLHSTSLSLKDVSSQGAAAAAEGISSKESGVFLKLVANQMSFEVLLNEVSTSVLTVYNQGPTAIHFEWKKVVKDNPLKVKAVNDGVQRFFFYHKKGVIQPGSAFDFRIIFKSASPGVIFF